MAGRCWRDANYYTPISWEACLAEREVISNLSEQCLMASENLKLALILLFLLFLDLGIVIFWDIRQASLLDLNLILAYFERWVLQKTFEVGRVISAHFQMPEEFAVWIGEKSAFFNMGAVFYFRRNNKMQMQATKLFLSVGWELEQVFCMFWLILISFSVGKIGFYRWGQKVGRLSLTRKL